MLNILHTRHGPITPNSRSSSVYIIIAVDYFFWLMLHREIMERSLFFSSRKG